LYRDLDFSEQILKNLHDRATKSYSEQHILIGQGKVVYFKNEILASGEIMIVQQAKN